MEDDKIKKGDFVVYNGRTLCAEFEVSFGFWWCSDNDGWDHLVEEACITANVTACIEL